MFDDELRRQLAKARRIARSVGRLLDQPRLPILCSPLVHLGDARRRRLRLHGRLGGRRRPRAGRHDRPRSSTTPGMSRALDVALVRTMLAQIADWERRPPAAIVPGLSVTLTRTGALSPVLPELVRDMLVRSRGQRRRCCWLGVPEAAVAHDLEAASRVVVALDELGVGVALRDFGSAVSSLEQLRRLPAPTMTIAGPLVAAVRDAGDADDAEHHAAGRDREVRARARAASSSRSTCRTPRTPAGCASSAATSGPAPPSGRPSVPTRSRSSCRRR